MGDPDGDEVSPFLTFLCKAEDIVFYILMLALGVLSGLAILYGVNP